jgi:hypothetical protein
MDLVKMLADLREERALIEEAAIECQRRCKNPHIAG